MTVLSFRPPMYKVAQNRNAAPVTNIAHASVLRTNSNQKDSIAARVENSETTRAGAHSSAPATPRHLNLRRPATVGISWIRVSTVVRMHRSTGFQSLSRQTCEHRRRCIARGEDLSLGLPPSGVEPRSLRAPPPRNHAEQPQALRTAPGQPATANYVGTELAKTGRMIDLGHGIEGDEYRCWLRHTTRRRKQRPRCSGTQDRSAGMTGVSAPSVGRHRRCLVWRDVGGEAEGGTHGRVDRPQHDHQRDKSLHTPDQVAPEVHGTILHHKFAIFTLRIHLPLPHASPCARVHRRLNGWRHPRSRCPDHRQPSLPTRSNVFDSTSSNANPDRAPPTSLALCRRPGASGASPCRRRGPRPGGVSAQ